MPAIMFLAVATGTWALLGLIAAFALIGLGALLMEPDHADTPSATRYTFGLGLNPHLVQLPEPRDIPATHNDLGDKGLRSIAADAGAKTRFTTNRYQLPDGRQRPYELSEDLPKGIQQIELTHDELTVWIQRDGTLTTSRPLTPEQRHDLETLLSNVETDADLRADRREWGHAEHTAHEANKRRA